MNVLDFFFPKYCIQCKKFGDYICANCFATISFDVKTKCFVCGGQAIDGMTHPGCQRTLTIDGVFSAVAYKRIMKKFLYQMKYKPYLTTLIPLAGELMQEALIQDELFVGLLNKNPVLVPIPLSKGKLRKRGYNHASLLAKEMGKRFNLPVKNLLERVKETKPQYGLKREERVKNMHEAFGMKPHPSPLLKGEGNQGTILLIDDVVTTGSTLVEAARILKKNGYERVFGVTLAQD